MSDVTREHRYSVTIRWRGNRGSGTSSYGAYARDHEIAADGKSSEGGKSSIAGSSDPLFRGDRTRWNPEELLVASLSACHQLWYLHLAADAGIVVTDYVDQAEGVMAERADGSGCFIAVVLRPVVTVAAGSDVARAQSLHHPAHEKCFIANSVNFPVMCEPTIVVAD
jgi:organic hydroperoxide reductase OsmC/OhrA